MTTNPDIETMEAEPEPDSEPRRAKVLATTLPPG